MRTMLKIFQILRVSEKYGWEERKIVRTEDRKIVRKEVGYVDPPYPKSLPYIMGPPHTFPSIHHLLLNILFS